MIERKDGSIIIVSSIGGLRGSNDPRCLLHQQGGRPAAGAQPGGGIRPAQRARQLHRAGADQHRLRARAVGQPGSCWPRAAPRRRCAASASPTRLPAPPCSWPRRPAPSSPARPSWSTAASPSERAMSRDPTTLEDFRAETRAWLEANCPAEMRQPMASEDDICWGGRNAQFTSDAQRLWLERMGERGWTVPTWPREYGGGGLSADEAKVLAQEMRALGLPPPLASFGIWMLGPGAAEVRQRGAEARAPAEDRARRDPLVPGLLRAGRRLGPRLAADARRGPRRPLHRQRPEDLDQLRRQGRLDLLPGAHRQRREEARRHQLRAVRHGQPGRQHQADPADLRQVAVLRDLLRQRARRQAQPRRRAPAAAGTSPSTC